MQKDLKYILVCLAAFLLAFPSFGKDLVFKGNANKVVSVKPGSSDGLDAIFVAESLDGVSVIFRDADAGNAVWYRYSNLGGGYAEEITSGISNSAGASEFSDPKGDLGYIIEYGDSRRYYFWLVDYSSYELKINSIEPAPEQDCSATEILFSMEGDPIKYYSINGRQGIVDREIKLHYYNLEWDANNMMYIQKEETSNIENATESVELVPPVYCATTFHVEGDRFQEAWGRATSLETGTFQPHSVAVETTATQEGKDTEENEDEDQVGSNVMHGDDSGLGGSAPAYITFNAYSTDAVIHHEWQISIDQNFETVDLRFNQQDLDYTFNEEGIFYVRYIGSNADGSCEAYSETYTVKIGASDIKCPNAFSPGTSPGVNDEWKVSYRSIIEFKCWIFNRYGVEMCHFTDPSQGWDGKYKGKYVKPGVYYYVIEARGADGRKYKLSGDINIIGYKPGDTTSEGGALPTE